MLLVCRKGDGLHPMQAQSNDFLEGQALRLAQQGNAAAFEFLYRLHRERVYALCLRMVKDPVQAEDLTQETFLAVLRGIREFRGQSTFSTWLHQVTRNTVLMAFRKRKVKELSLEEIAEPDRESGRQPMEFGTTDRRLEGTPDRMTLLRAVSKLSRGFRAALLLHDVHGYEHKEVAAIMGYAPGTSKSQLHKARVRVRELLNKYFRSHRRDDNHSDNPPGDEASVPPSPRSEKSGSDAENRSRPDNLPRKPQRAIPSWCEPIDEEVPRSSK
jgi:RNA polymerase sigma-70 factor, ECF subfamily